MNRYESVLLKLSGESLGGRGNNGIDAETLRSYAAQIHEVVQAGTRVAIVIGGGNIFRGLSGLGKGVDRVKGDQMGMLATVINSLGLQSALAAVDCPACVMTAVGMEPIGVRYNKDAAMEMMRKGVVVIVAGGTGNPYFTTDSASALRAVELEVDVLLKGTRVDGIYTADPEKDQSATKFTEISFEEVYDRGLKIMDLTAFTLCKENAMPILVFDMDTPGNLARVVGGEKIGTVVQ